MPEARTCPRCRLINPPDAQRCDCGYDFAAGSMKQSYLSPGRPNPPNPGARVVGFGCLIIAPILLLSGVVTALKTWNAGGDEAFVLGQMCGAFCPGVLALAFAAYLLRRKSTS